MSSEVIVAVLSTKLTVSVPTDLFDAVRRDGEGTSVLVQRALRALAAEQESAGRRVTRGGLSTESTAAIVSQLSEEAEELRAAGYEAAIEASGKRTWFDLERLPDSDDALREWAKDPDRNVDQEARPPWLHEALKKVAASKGAVIGLIQYDEGANPYLQVSPILLEGFVSGIRDLQNAVRGRLRAESH